MSKHWSTLRQDLENVLRTGSGWNEEISQWVGATASQSLTRQFSRGTERSSGLRLSAIGTPCERKLWYSTRRGTPSESHSASTLNKFIFGDLTESYLLGLVKASGHSLEGLQDTVVVSGIKGHRDCIIDGMLFDVKSASSRAFEKFKANGLRKDDPFGYISQISSYLFGSLSDPLLTEKTKVGFLVMDKQFGHIAVDIYDVSEELEKKEAEIERKKALCASDELPPRDFEPVPFNKSGNEKLATFCSYCEFKHQCYPDLRGFVYSNGPVWLTKVVKEPREAMEIF